MKQKQTKEEVLEKARLLIEWVDSQNLPEKNVPLNEFTVIIHTPSYIKINKERLANCEPFSACWKVGYFALYNFKKSFTKK